MATIEQLRDKANLVANATQVGENSAQRVGGALQDAADLISQLLVNDGQMTEVDVVQNKDISSLKAAVSGLRNALNSESSTRAQEDIALKRLIDALQNQVTMLTGANANEAIESFNEVIKFLDGIKDSKSLTGLLSAINKRLDGLENKKPPQDVYEVLEFDGFSNEVVNPLHQIASPEANIIFNMPRKCFVADDDGMYSDGWNDVDKYQFYKNKWLPYNGKIYIDKNTHIPYHWDGFMLVAIAPKSVPTSIFNVTSEIPINGYYSLVNVDNHAISAVHCAWKEERAMVGLIITMEISAGIWKTYQYVGKNISESSWFNVRNWKNLEGLAYGKSAYELAKEQGYVGTLADWLASLKGERGAIGWLPVVIHDEGTALVEMNACEEHHIKGKVTQLYFTVNKPAQTNTENEYRLCFATGNAAPNISFPESVKMPAGVKFAANRYYELSIAYNAEQDIYVCFIGEVDV